MRNFTIEDFKGSGQYLIRNDKPRNEYKDAGFMSTIMIKVGYCLGQGTEEKYQKDYENITTLIDMSDGKTALGYFNTRNDPNWQMSMSAKGPANTSLWIWVPFNSKQALCDYLNNPELSQEYRFASQEEVIRVILHQKHRCK